MKLRIKEDPVAPSPFYFIFIREGTSAGKSRLFSLSLPQTSSSCCCTFHVGLLVDSYFLLLSSSYVVDVKRIEYFSRFRNAAVCYLYYYGGPSLTLIEFPPVTHFYGLALTNGCSRAQKSGAFPAKYKPWQVGTKAWKQHQPPFFYVCLVCVCALRKKEHEGSFLCLAPPDETRGKKLIFFSFSGKRHV